MYVPNRILKESICTSETIDQLSAFEETFFYRLIVNCDDYGLMDARPAILKSRLFPLKEIRTQQIEDALRKLTSAELVSTYVVDGKPFLLMNTWDRHQQIRAAKAKFPGPDGKYPSGGKAVKTSDIIRNQMISNDGKCSRNPIQSESDTLKETPLTGSKEKAGAKTGAKAAGADAPDRAFDTFWAVYPRRENKQAARKAFVKIHPDPELLEVMLSAVQRQKQTEQWSDPKYIPHAATWLNGRRWEDEPVKAAAPVPVKQVSAQRYTQRDYDEQELEKRLGVNDLFAKEPKEAKA